MESNNKGGHTEHIQAVFTISTVLSVLLDTLYIILCCFTKISVCTNIAQSNNKMGL
jgi:hypothetical protein